jgi:FeS assembly SUF system protein
MSQDDPRPTPDDAAPDRAAASSADDTAPTGDGALDPAELRERIVEMLKTCYDPEIPVDIYELGLIYRVDVGDGGNVEIDMTLTSPACPVAGSLPGEVESKVRGVDGVGDVTLELVWDPPWDKDRMSDAAKLKLGFF